MKEYSDIEFESDELKHVKGDNLEYLQFKRLLEFPNLQHAYILKTYNMNFRLGTNFRNIETVKDNLKTVCDELKIPIESIIRPDYNHTTNTKIVEYVDNSIEIPEISGKRFKDVDGLITNKSRNNYDVN